MTAHSVISLHYHINDNSNEKDKGAVITTHLTEYSKTPRKNQHWIYWVTCPLMRCFSFWSPHSSKISFNPYQVLSLLGLLAKIKYNMYQVSFYGRFQTNYWFIRCIRNSSWPSVLTSRSSIQGVRGSKPGKRILRTLSSLMSTLTLKVRGTRN